MYTEKTSTGRYAVHNLTKEEIELLIDGLVVLKSEKLTDSETQSNSRRICVQMYQSMTKEAGL